MIDPGLAARLSELFLTIPVHSTGSLFIPMGVCWILASGWLLSSPFITLLHIASHRLLLISLEVMRCIVHTFRHMRFLSMICKRIASISVSLPVSIQVIVIKLPVSWLTTGETDIYGYYLQS